MVVIRRKKTAADKKQADLNEGRKVALEIISQTKMGFVAVINQTRKGVLYKNEIFQPLKIGQKIDGYIKKIRDDNKIDLCLQKPGFKAIDPQLKQIMDELYRNNGFLPLTDKTSPKVIVEKFGISKKAFKKAIGNLYKKRLITLERDGIRLKEKQKPPPRKSTARYRKSAPTSR